MGSLLSSNIGSMLSQIVSPVNQQPTQPTGITSIPVTNQNPMVNMTGGRFNQVRDPRLNRVASRPMFRTSRYDSQISDLLSRLIPQTENKANGGRIGYENGGSSKTSPKFIPMDMESVAKRLFERNLDNLTYNEKQTIYDYIEANRNKKANGGRIGYADGAGPIPLGLVDYRGTPWENSFKLISQPQSVERKMGLFTNPDGSYPDGNIPNPIQALPRPGMPTTQTETNVNPIERSLEMAGFTKEEIMRIMGERGFSNGGRVSMSEGGLTKTVPPAKGPDSQGVESLFRRRYS
jgi:hypothetical protein